MFIIYQYFLVVVVSFLVVVVDYVPLIFSSLLADLPDWQQPRSSVLPGSIWLRPDRLVNAKNTRTYLSQPNPAS